MQKRLLIINGATRGLGFSILDLISKNDNFEIVTLVRNELSAKKKYLNYPEVKIVKCDYSNIKEAQLVFKAFEKIFEYNYSEIYFINNISNSLPIGLIGNLNSDELISSLNINIVSNLTVVNIILHYFYKQSINCYLLNISSAISKNPIPGIGLYGLGKAASDYITLLLKKEFIKENMFVSTFYPGGMKTEMQSIIRDKISSNKSLEFFNYESFFKQKLNDSDIISKIVFDNFIEKKIGWDKDISSIYDYI